MTTLRYIRLQIEPLLYGLGRITHTIFSYKLMQKLYGVHTLLYTAWVRNAFRSVAKGVILYPSITIKGGEFIQIDNMTVIGAHTILTAWNLVPSITPALTIGKACDIGEYAHISCANRITIGDGVLLGRWVTIVDNAHGHLCEEQKDISPIDRAIEIRKGTTIEDNVWVGDKVTILPGVTIGRGSVIAANAVVTTDIPPYSVAAGIPAKIVKKL